MPRKRRRRRLNVGPVLWLLFWGSTVIGLFISPITAAARIRVVGAKSTDQSRIDRELQWLKTKPCLRVNHRSVEEWLMYRPDVKNATLHQNILGSASVEMSYYEPVAAIDGKPGLVLTESGALCSIPDKLSNLPNLKLPAEETVPFLAVSSNWEPEKVAEICKRSSESGLIKNLSFTVTVSGSVCLNSGETGRVLMGAPDDIDEKFEKLRQILASQPELLSQGKELVLIAPTKPATRPLQGQPQ